VLALEEILKPAPLAAQRRTERETP
jgi:hypothetical protein